MDFLRALSTTSSDQVARKAPKLLELPVELRLQIFDYVLQGVFLHVTPRPGAYAYAKWTYLAADKPANWMAIGFHAARMLRVLLGGMIDGDISCR
jgi:hypothetical protein